MYAAPKSGYALDPGELRAFASRRLPPFMVPRAIMILNDLPLTANGKVNRAALPGPKFIRPFGADTLVRPRTRTEEKLAEIWTRVLGLTEIGVEDDFFLLGGQSLIAIRMSAEIQAVFDRKLPLEAIFRNPTIAALAMRLEHSTASEMAGTEQVIRPVRRELREQRLTTAQEK